MDNLHHRLIFYLVKKQIPGKNLLNVVTFYSPTTCSLYFHINNIIIFLMSISVPIPTPFPHIKALTSHFNVVCFSLGLLLLLRSGLSQPFCQFSCSSFVASRITRIVDFVFANRFVCIPTYFQVAHQLERPFDYVTSFPF